MTRRRCLGLAPFLACSLCFILLLLTPLPAHAQDAEISEQAAEEEGGQSGLSGGLPLPRFVSIAVAKANMRKGPGRRYPIDWVLVRRHLPVEVIEEFENWRKVRDRSGQTGWVHKAMLSGKRTAMITREAGSTELVSLFESASQDKPPALMAQPGAIGEVKECEGNWCSLSFKQGEGWVRREYLWGVYPGEEFD